MYILLPRIFRGIFHSLIITHFLARILSASSFPCLVHEAGLTSCKSHRIAWTLPIVRRPALGSEISWWNSYDWNLIEEPIYHIYIPNLLSSKDPLARCPPLQISLANSALPLSAQASRASPSPLAYKPAMSRSQSTSAPPASEKSALALAYLPMPSRR